MRYAPRSLFSLLCLALLALPACDSGGEEPPNQTPTASFSFTPNGARAGSDVAFANQSSDRDGQITDYSWDFDGDGVEDASSRNPSYSFSERGNYTASLTVTDDDGSAATTSEAINISARFNSARVTGVAILDIPFTDSGGTAWDSNSGPDVYYAVISEEEGPLSVATQDYPDLSPAALPIAWNTNFVIPDLHQNHYVYLFDLDPNAESDAIIGYIAFKLESFVGDYPSGITLGGSQGEIQLALEWEHDGSDAATSSDSQLPPSFVEPDPQAQRPIERIRPRVNR